jgi:hypothetical protein
MPVAACVTQHEPSAQEIARLYGCLVERHGAPPHLVTDQGGQFTGEVFRNAVKTAGCRLRFGAVGKSGSIAVIERLCVR